MAEQAASVPPSAPPAGGGWRDTAGRYFSGLTSGLNAIGTAWIFFIMMLINADVFLRFAFDRPLTGVPLTVSMSIVSIVFLQLADALKLGRMIRNEVLISRLLSSRPAVGNALEAAFHLGGAVSMIAIFYYSYPFLEKAWESQSYLGTAGDFTLPEWPVKLMILIGSSVCAIQFLLNFRRDLKVLGGLPETRKYWPLACVLGVVVLIVVALQAGVLDSLSDIGVGLLSVLLMLILVYLGVHVAIALASLSFICIWLLRDSPEIAGKMLSLAASESLQRYEFGVIPLFVLMGLLVSISDVGRETYEVANQLFRRIKGGLGTATVFANAVFAAVTGTSIASASVFTKVAVPEMLRLGYYKRFAVGVVAGSSVLGMLIPPSLLLILFGIIAETSIGDLFLAGIVPGIVLSLAYALLIALMAHRFPSMVFSEEGDHMTEQPIMSLGEMLIKIAPIVSLIIIVLGGIYGGVFTATEAGGVGAMGALILAIARRTLSWSQFWHVLVETGHVTAAISFLLIGAHIYARMIAVTGIPDALEIWIEQSGLGYTGLIVIYLALIIAMGTILDAGSIMLITVPLAVPVLIAMEGAGVETNGLVWFGIITIIGVEIGLLTPPLGIACFVIHNNLQDPRISVNDVFWGAAPFALTMVIVLALVVIFPDIALILVE